MDGPFTVITRVDGDQFVYLEAQGRSNLLTGRAETQTITARYGIIRSQALSPDETTGFIENLLEQP